MTMYGNIMKKELNKANWKSIHNRPMPIINNIIVLVKILRIRLIDDTVKSNWLFKIDISSPLFLDDIYS